MKASEHEKAAQAAATAAEEVIFEGQVGGGASAAGWHSIESAWRCYKEYQFQHVRGLRKPLHQQPDYFAVGALFHAGRARWFTRRFGTAEADWDSIKAAVQAEAEAQELPITLKAEQDALRLLTLYCEHWSKRPRPEPVAAEYNLGPAPFRPGGIFYRTARLDDVSRYPEAAGALCIGESKTTSGSLQDTVNQYTLHGQTMMQMLLWKYAPQGEARFGPIKYIMLDVTKKVYDGKKPEFGRFPIPITEHALTWFADNLHHHLKHIAAIDWNTEVPRNVAMCTRLIGRARVECPYRELCLHGKSASIGYVLKDGSSLMKHVRRPGFEAAPWD